MSQFSDSSNYPLVFQKLFLLLPTTVICD
jgi:hypothetical protein